MKQPTTPKTTKKTKKKTTPQPTTRRKNNPVFVIDEVLDLKDFKRKPITNTKVERLAHALLEWVQQPDALRLHQFTRQEGFPYRYLDRFCKASEIFKEAYGEALLTLADRRELGGLERKYDPGMIRSTQPHYCPIAKEQAFFNAELRKKEQDNGTTIFKIERNIGDENPQTITWTKDAKPKDSKDEI